MWFLVISLTTLLLYFCFFIGWQNRNDNEYLESKLCKRFYFWLFLRRNADAEVWSVSEGDKMEWLLFFDVPKCTFDPLLIRPIEVALSFDFFCQAVFPSRIWTLFRNSPWICFAFLALSLASTKVKEWQILAF